VTVPLVLAHLGHWLEFAFFAPPAVLVLAATARSVRDMRAQKRAGAAPTPRKESS